jgi:hypothetical protein
MKRTLPYTCEALAHLPDSREFSHRQKVKLGRSRAACSLLNGGHMTGFLPRWWSTVCGRGEAGENTHVQYVSFRVTFAIFRTCASVKSGGWQIALPKLGKMLLQVHVENFGMEK